MRRGYTYVEIDWMKFYTWYDLIYKLILQSVGKSHSSLVEENTKYSTQCIHIYKSQEISIHICVIVVQRIHVIPKMIVQNKVINYVTTNYSTHDNSYSLFTIVITQ